MPLGTIQGFWRLDWTELKIETGSSAGFPATAIGVLPTKNGIIRNTGIEYVYGIANIQPLPPGSGLVMIGGVFAGGEAIVKMDDIAGKYRIPSSSLTHFLDASDLYNSGIVRATTIGNSWSRQSTTKVPNPDGGTYESAYFAWKGPKLNENEQATALISVVSNAPNHYSALCKEDCLYSVCRSADMHWADGNLSVVRNPLMTGFASIFPLLNVPAFEPQEGMEPILSIFSNLDSRGTINSKSISLLEFTPDATSPLMPFRRKNIVMPKLFREMSVQRAEWGSLFSKDWNDRGILANMVKSTLPPMAGAAKMDKWGTLAELGKAGLGTLGSISANRQATKAAVKPVKYTTKAEVKMKKAEEKTKRKAIKKGSGGGGN